MIGVIILGIAGILFSGNTVNGAYWGNVLVPMVLAALGNAFAYLLATTAAVAKAKSEDSVLVLH